MSNTAITILIVEDEPDILNINARLLKRRGYNVITASSVEESYRCLSSVTPDLLILDIMLPDGSGYDICERFRSKCYNPVIFLTGKTQIPDKVEGLKCGGDYYLTKPYNFDELLAVADRLITRHFEVKAKQEQLESVTKCSITLDFQKRKAYVNGQDAGLTAKEFSLLCFLMRNEDKVLSPGELYEAVWGMPSTDDTRTVRFHIRNLKKKLDTENAEEFDIISVYGKGYTFTTK